MPYRLYRREPVKRGNWYYTVTCPDCGSLIYALNATAEEVENPIPIRGEQSEILTACLACGADSLHPNDDLKVVQAHEDLSCGRPERVPISKASRTPFNRSGAKAGAIIGVGYIEDRPRCAAIVGRIITSWADIEVSCAMLLAEMMGANAAPAAAAFGSMRSSRVQHDALNSVAEITLNDGDYELFSAYMARRASLESQRNDLAHGCYGVCVPIKDGIVWAAQADYLTLRATFKSDPTGAPERFRAKQFIYYEGTLQRIAEEIEEYHSQLGQFTGYLSARRKGADGETFREWQFPRLCNLPHIRQALAQIRIARAKPSTRQKSSRGPQKGKR